MKSLSSWSSGCAGIPLALALAAVAAGCGGDDSASPPDAGDSGAHVEAGKAHDASKGHDAAKGADTGKGHDAAPDAGIVDAPSLDGWSVPTGCNPIGVTSECMLPYPSDFLTVSDPSTPTGLRVALPQGSLVVPDAAIPIDMTPFNRGDGFPTSAPILVHFGVDVDPSFLADQTKTASSVASGSPIALFDEATGERMPFLSEMDVNAPTQTDRHALIIRPLTPLAFHEKYVVVISNTLRDIAGQPLPVSKGFAALADKISTDVPALEAARSHYEDLFTFLASHGYPRGSLALAWDYTTASSHTVIGPISAMREEVFHATTSMGSTPDGGADAATDAQAGMNLDASVDAGPGSISYVISSVTASPYVTGANIIEGTFAPPNYLKTDNTIEYTRDNVPVLQTALPAPSYPFTMIVPPLGATKSLGLLVFGHGLFGTGRSYLTSDYGNVIQPLAQELGSVVIATDWIGLSGDDLSLIISDVIPNLNRVGIVTDRLLQALVNNLSLVELSLGALEQDPRVRLSVNQPLIDPSQVHYYGVSLGGIEGSSLLSVSRNITRGIVAVPGASWSNLLARSYDYQQIGGAIALTYPDELLQQEFITLLQSRFDPADPINLATLFQKSPLPGSPSPRIALIQESIDDCQVPNLTTEMLARAYGISEVSPDIVPIYGLPSLTTPTTKNALSQFKLTSDVNKYVPPISNVIPAQDNGAHFDLAFQGAALEEVVSLISTGSIVQSCADAGPCVLP